MAVYYGKDSFGWSYIVWNHVSYKQVDVILSLIGKEYDEDDEFFYNWYFYGGDDWDGMMEVVEVIKTAGIKVKEDDSKIAKKSKRIENE